MADTRKDGFLNGRLRIEQPAAGYRSGADAVMLAAACPARSGQSVLELGCGAGVASLCLGRRVPGLALTGIELQPDFAELAQRNAETNGINMQVLTGDLADPPAELRQMSFDHVIANPPYFRGGTPAPNSGRAMARHEDTPLPVWVDAALRRLRPGGHLVMIQQAARLADLLAALAGKTGDIAVLPIAARDGRDAGRILVGARKGTGGPLRLCAPFVMHAETGHAGDREDLTMAASAVLRDATSINLW